MTAEPLSLYIEKIKGYAPETVIMDAGYRTPAIAHELLQDGVLPLLPYKPPMTKAGFLKKHEYVYDEYYDCYICLEEHILTYRTTNRDGYREYKSCGERCANCPSLKRCTHSKSHVKTVARHVWEEYMEIVEDIRHTCGHKEAYEEGDHRADFRDCERTAWVPLHTIHREGADGDESRAYFRMHELKETGRDPCQKRKRGLTVPGTSMHFKENIFQDKREALGFNPDISLCLQSESLISQAFFVV